MLKNSIKEKFKDIKFVFIDKTFKSFNELKHLFIYAPMLVYYNPICRIMLEYNVFEFEILVIQSQLVVEID